MSTSFLTSTSRGQTPRTVLVTGGAGFIGSHLVERLMLVGGPGDRVVVIDDLSTGRRSNLDGAFACSGSRLTLIEADVSDGIRALAGSGEGSKAPARFDEIYHLAAAVGVKLVIDEPIRSIETNVLGTSDVLRFALTHGPGGGPAPTLITSSSEVYGKTERSPFAEEDDAVYGPTTRSRWSYAASKAIDEYLALAYHAKHQLPAVVVRLFNTTGPRQLGSYGMVLPGFVAAALQGHDLEVYGDGGQSRCFADVRDVASALPQLVRTPSCHGRVFNLGSDRSITILQLAEMVITSLGSSSKIRLVRYDQAYGPGFEDLRRREPDLTRVRAAIRYAPTITLEQTIRNIAAGLRAGPVALPVRANSAPASGANRPNSGGGGGGDGGGSRR